MTDRLAPPPLSEAMAVDPHTQPTVQLVGMHEHSMRVGRSRLIIIGMLFAACFALIAGRLVELSVLGGDRGNRFDRLAVSGAAPSERADIVDRNGLLLATNLPTASLYANARVVPEPAHVVEQLMRVLPGLNRSELLAKLTSRNGFVWLKRNLSPQEQYDVNSLGIPGLGFQQEQRRVYPHGRLVSHVLGYTDVDNNGIAGIENYFDAELKRRAGSAEPIELSLDLRVQHAVRDELRRAMRTFSAHGAAGVVMDVDTGEVLAMVSLPDFDSNHAGSVVGDARFNRVSLGVYELGSVFKIFTIAMALDAGTVDFRSGYDATKPIRVSRFIINDDHPKNRWLSVPEIFMFSSNIGAVKMALDVGTDAQRAFMRRLGMFRQPAVELPEIGTPLGPQPWREVSTMTVAFGHGLAVSPLQLTAGVGAMINGGLYRRPTLIKQQESPAATRVISARTSDRMRRLMRLAVTEGTGRQADVPYTLVGGKTGTAEKARGRRYDRNALLSSFVAAFPMHAPRYVVYVLLDEPRGTAKTHGFASAGWTAAPTAGHVIARIGPILGVAPVDPAQPEIREAMKVAIPGQGAKYASF